MNLHATIEGQDSFVLRIMLNDIYNNVVAAPIKSVSKVTRFCSIEAASRFCSVEVLLASRFVASRGCSSVDRRACLTLTEHMVKVAELRLASRRRG